MAMSFRESFARVNSKDPTVTALTSLTVTATEGYTTMRDLTQNRPARAMSVPPPASGLAPYLTVLQDPFDHCTDEPQPGVSLSSCLCKEFGLRGV